MKWGCHELQWEMLGRKGTVDGGLDRRTDSTAEMTGGGDQGYPRFTWSERSQRSPRDERGPQFYHESGIRAPLC